MVALEDQDDKGNIDHMRFIEAMAPMLAMDERTWRRHANPWSVWTRIPLLLVFVAALFWRDELGWWTYAILIVAVAWAIVNPRAFPEPQSTDNWASRAVMGERVWLNRRAVPIPADHERWAMGLSLASAAGLIPLVWGLYDREPWLTAFGTLWVMGAKLWFVDRMVWLFEVMSRDIAEYRGWMVGRVNSVDTSRRTRPPEGHS